MGEVAKKFNALVNLWYDGKRGRCEHSLDPVVYFDEYGRHEDVYDRRGDRLEGRESQT